MILDDVIADDLRRLGFETTRKLMGPPDKLWTDFFLPTKPDRHFLRLKYNFDFAKKTCELGNIDVHPDYRSQPETGYPGHGIGRAVIQRISREAIRRRIQHIELNTVMGGGLSLWPALGAYPSNLNEQRFQRALLRVVTGDNYERADRALATNALDMLRNKVDMRTAWKSVAKKQKDGGPSTACLAAITRHTLFNDMDMLLDLTDPIVLVRLGLTPPAAGL